MTRQELECLQTPYTRDQLGDPGRFANVLGVRVASVRDLERAIVSDLDAERFGIGWWAPHPGTIRRILISDYLYMCVSSIETNLVEAKVHLMEARAAGERQERLWIAAVTAPDRGGRVSLQHPEMSCPADELLAVLAQAHVVGCVRALASALDCFAAVAVGVLALPTKIFKVHYSRVRKQFWDQQERSERGLQQVAGNQMSDLIRAAGPRGWDDWVLGYRNMLVHRGRRMWMTQILPTGTVLHQPSGGAILPSRLIPQLPNDPGRSDVEVLRDGSEKAFLLSENGWNTLEAVLRSTKYVMEEGGKILGQVWAERRSDPTLLLQPGEQWPKSPLTEDDPAHFDGYAPESVPVNPGLMSANPDFVARLRAAALESKRRALWSTFEW